MEQFLEKIPWGMVVLLCLTLGLAPFKPPHILEKLTMLFQGRLVRPIDWFDLILHSAPWVLLILKLIFGRK
jgi:F0F1-type ATP synthase assembly protein I